MLTKATQSLPRDDDYVVEKGDCQQMNWCMWGLDWSVSRGHISNLRLKMFWGPLLAM